MERQFPNLPTLADTMCALVCMQLYHDVARPFYQCLVVVFFFCNIADVSSIKCLTDGNALQFSKIMPSQ